MPQSSGILSTQEVANAASSAGMSGEHLKIMVAIARAESSNNPRAINYVPCYGLWQINMSGSMGATRRKQFGISSNDQLFDPKINARAAEMIYKQQGYRAWSVYNSGSYKKFLGASFSASQSPSSGTPTDPQTGTAVPTNSTADQLSFDFFGIRKTIREFTDTTRQIAIMTLIVIIALVLLILGIVLINKDEIKKGAKTVAGIAGAIK
jgi:hypothetical protein